MSIGNIIAYAIIIPMRKSRVIIIIAGVVAVILGAVLLARTTPPSTSGSGVGLKIEPLVVNQAEPLQVSAVPVPAAKSPQTPSAGSGQAISISPSTLSAGPKSLGLVESPTTTIMNLNGQQYHLLVADDLAEWQQGLMNRTSLPGFDGMAFVFPKSEPRTFWNKNTHLDLIVIWANGTNVLGVEALPSIDKTKTVKSISSPGPVDRVVEIVVK